MRILLVEDSADMRLLLKMELEALGHTVLSAENGFVALEMAGCEPPDLIISDIRMPDMDGYDLIRRVRSIPELASIPCIALTALATETSAGDGLAAGFNASISKFIDPDGLAQIIEELADG